MVSPRYSVSNIRTLFSLISSHAPILCLRLPSTPRFYKIRDQAPGSTSLLSFVSDAAVFPDPLFLKDCGFDLICPSGGGSHRAMAGCRPLPGMLAGCAAADAQRPRPGASPPRKKFVTQCSSSASGIMENHSTHLAPGSAPSDLVPAPGMWPFSRVRRGLCLCGGNAASTRCPPSRGTASPVWPEAPRTPLCSWGVALPTRAPPGMELRSFSLCSPCLQSLQGIYSLSFFPF